MSSTPEESFLPDALTSEDLDRLVESWILDSEHRLVWGCFADEHTLEETRRLVDGPAPRFRRRSKAPVDGGDPVWKERPCGLLHDDLGKE